MPGTPRPPRRGRRPTLDVGDEQARVDQNVVRHVRQAHDLDSAPNEGAGIDACIAQSASVPVVVEMGSREAGVVDQWTERAGRGMFG